MSAASFGYLVRLTGEWIRQFHLPMASVVNWASNLGLDYLLATRIVCLRTNSNFPSLLIIVLFELSLVIFRLNDIFEELNQVLSDYQQQ